MIRQTLYSILIVLLSFSVYASDDRQMETDDGYIIHYNAFSTNFLTAKVAKTYNIKRSKKRAMLNISIRKIGKDKVSQTEAVTAVIKAKVTNFIGQPKNIKIRQVNEENAIYYIADFTVANQEIIKFDLQVTPGDKTHTIKFEQQFFID
ncbi:MAG TPA: DUF4426 domain-containing protein [Thioploca sp.]|nr:DUF4426 domain-containing protein [Thioploca sp.]